MSEVERNLDAYTRIILAKMMPEIEQLISKATGGLIRGGKLVLNASTGTLPGSTIPYGAAGYPVDVAATEADGTASTAARSDHRHKLAIITTEDDIIVGGASGVPGRLGKGTDSQVLTVDPTTHHLVWADPPAGGAHTILSATHTDTDTTAPSDGDVPTWDNAAGKWKAAAPPAGGGSVATDTIFDAKGDLPVGTGANTAARLAVGTDRKLVRAASSASTGLEYVLPTAANILPTDLTGLLLWLRADSLALSNDDPISTWADESGGSRDFTGTTTTRPLYRTNILNSLPAVRFDGTDDKLGAASAIIPSNAIFSLFIVTSPTSEATYGSLLSQWAAAQAGRFILVSNQNDAGNNAAGLMNLGFVGVTEGAGTGAVALDWGYTAPMLLSIVNNGKSEGGKHFHNGYLIDSWTWTAAYNGVNTGLGRDVAAALQAYDGDVFEVIIYSRALSDPDRRAIEAYLANKWGL